MTTPERMKTTAPHLATMSDAALLMFIEDATVEVAKLKAPDEYIEKLTRYLAIHFASLSDKTVKSEKVGDLARTYAEGNNDSGLLSTQYGAEYQRIVDSLPGVSKKRRLNLTVI